MFWLFTYIKKRKEMYTLSEFEWEAKNSKASYTAGRLQFSCDFSILSSSRLRFAAMGATVRHMSDGTMVFAFRIKNVGWYHNQPFEPDVFLDTGAAPDAQ